MASVFELVYVAAIVVCAAFASRNNEHPYRVDMCLRGSGPNGEDVATNVWSDYVERYKERYPGSTCGTCEKEKPCPSKKKKK